MKISCQSCHSKYNVADEKVQGKIVKIRCRKCGATIVVNGTGGAATNGTSAAEAGGGAHGAAVAGDTTQWHVNVAENDQRTLTIAELIDAYNTGVVTQDTFIWTDGMDDWKPLAEVEAVVAALHASANQMAVGTPGAFEAAAGGYEQAASMAPAPEAAAYQAPAYEAPAAYAAPAPEPKRAAVAKRDARARDLFATNAGEELHTSAPAAPAGGMPHAGGGEAGLTGQRNENSVLFSLAVLTQNSDARAQNEPAPTNTEDSGLIDLKALAAKAESMRPPPGFGGDVFSAPLGMTPPLGAPMGALSTGPEGQPKSKLPLFIGAGAGVLVLLVLGIVIGVKIAGSGPTPIPTMVITTVTAPAEPPPSATASATAEASASAAPSASVATGPKRFTGTGGGYHPPGPGPGPKPVVGGSGGGGSSGGTSPSPAPVKKGGDCGCNGDLMCLMKCSTH